MIHKVILYILLITVMVSLFNDMAVADPDGYEPIIFVIGFQDRDESWETFRELLENECGENRVIEVPAHYKKNKQIAGAMNTSTDAIQYNINAHLKPTIFDAKQKAIDNFDLPEDQPPKVILIGHSRGGMISTAYTMGLTGGNYEYYSLSELQSVRVFIPTPEARTREFYESGRYVHL